MMTAWLVLGCAAVASAQSEGSPLFDGKTLTGWEGDPRLWSVEEGAITGRTSAEAKLTYNQFLIWRGGEVDDFELTLEYRIESGNSGVQYRSFTLPEVGKYSVGGYQADFEAGDTYSGILYAERDRGILAQRGQKTVIGDNHKPKVVGSLGDGAELGKSVKKGEWNHYRVLAKGYHFQHFINDTQMVDVVDEDAAKRRRSGILALQLHQGPPMKAQFRNIRLKRLPLQDAKKAVLVAGPVSHGYLQHEHRAGCLLLAEALNRDMPGMVATVYSNGWPKDPTAFDNADTVLIYCDGADGHLALAHLEQMDALMKRGVGLVCLHFATEVPKGPGGDKFLEWMGGYFELNWSVNPHWTAEFKEFPSHPIARGLRTFSVTDEIYYHMRFRPDLRDVTPILSTVPPNATFEKKDGPRSGNPAVRAEKGKPQTVAWAAERPGGGRGFGFTGGHFHFNWANPGYRRVVLNAIVWTARGQVPAAGVPLRAMTYDELIRDVEPKGRDTYRDYPEAETRELVKKWNEAIKSN